MIQFLANPPDYLQFVVLQKYLESQGYKYLGNSAPTADSEDFNAEVIKQIQNAEKVVVSPVIEYNSLFSTSTIIPGKWAYFVYPAAEEDLPDTLRGGFRVERVDPSKNPASSMRKITKLLPSELLNELERQNVLIEHVTEFYFEHPGGYEALVRCGLHQFKNNRNQPLRYHLSADDVTTLSRMENHQVLDLKELHKRTVDEDDRKARRSLENILIKSGLVVPIRKSSARHTLSKAATEGEYTAMVEKRYMPDSVY